MIAGTILLAWPLIAIAMFSALGLLRGLIWVTLIGFLFLPEGYGFDLPGVIYDKRTAIAFSLVLAAFLTRKHENLPVFTGDRRLKVILILLTVVLFLAPVFTVLDNRYPLIDGRSFRPALGAQDLLGLTLDFAVILAPYFLARRWLIRPQEHTLLLFAIVTLGLGYSLLVLIEIRLSPQMHTWVYGYFPHAFSQHVRGGSFRPLVFLNHGLELGFYLFMAVIAAFALTMQEAGRRIPLFLAGLWLLAVLLVSHNLGAAMLAFLFVPVVLFLRARLQLLAVAVVAGLFLSYPALRQAELMPVDSFTNFVSNISEDRARSFEFRLKNEDALLERALEKPLFGWGPWARGQIFNDRGDMISVPDGIWVIVMGDRGWAGFLGLFGLMAVPLWYLRRTRQRKDLQPATIGLAIIATGNLIYMIPNSTVSPVSALVFGALAGFAQSDEKKIETAEEPRARYSRFAPGERAFIARE